MKCSSSASSDVLFSVLPSPAGSDGCGHFRRAGQSAVPGRVSGGQGDRARLQLPQGGHAGGPAPVARVPPDEPGAHSAHHEGRPTLSRREVRRSPTSLAAPVARIAAELVRSSTRYSGDSGVDQAGAGHPGVGRY